MADRIQESIFKTIDTITQVYMSKMKVDKTISAIVTKRLDLAQKKYEVSYNGGSLTVYAQPYDDTVYEENQSVYILVPENDFTNKKILMGRSDISESLTGTPLAVAPGEVNSLLKPQNEGYKISVNRDGYKTLTIESTGDLIAKIRNADSVILKASFYAGKLDSKYKRSIAHYGIRVNLKMGENSTLPIILDSKKMSGTPLYYSTYVSQSVEFNIDKNTFQSIESIELFTLDFARVDPEHVNEDNEKECIYVKDIELVTTSANSNFENYTVRLSYSNGDLLNGDDGITSTTVSAEVISNSSVLSPELYEIFWFDRNPEIKQTTDTNYNPLGGLGWEQLAAADKNNLVINNSKGYENHYKCVISLRQGEETYRLYKNFVIYDYSKPYYAEIITPSTLVKYGTTTLTCKLFNQDGTEYVSTEAIYTWFYDDDVLMSAATAIIEIDVSEFSDTRTFTCLVSHGDYLDTDSITIDRTAVEQMLPYRVVIENGNQQFKYDANGYSPAYKYKQEPQPIFGLKGLLYHGADSEPIAADSYTCFWNTENSLLTNLQGSNNECIFELEDEFDPSRAGGQVECVINYEGQSYRGVTNFSIFKDNTDAVGKADFIRVDYQDDVPFLSNRQTSLELPKIQKNGEDLAAIWKAQSNKLSIVDGVVNYNETDPSDEDFILFAEYGEEKVAFYCLPYVYYKNEEAEEVFLKSPKDLWYPLLREVIYDYAGLNPKYNKNYDMNKVVYDKDNKPIAFSWEGIDIFAQYDGSSIYYMTAENEDVKIYIPVYIHYNTDVQPMFVGWDGRSVKVGNDYITTPQLAAGKQNESGFTGIALGERSGGEIGLFGYLNSNQTMFLDAETGNATFGANDEIVLRPNGDSTVGGWKINDDAFISKNGSIELNPIDNQDNQIKVHIGGNDTFAIYKDTEFLAGILDGKFVSANEGVIENNVYVGYISPLNNGLQIKHPTKSGLMATLSKEHEGGTLIIKSTDNDYDIVDLELQAASINFNSSTNITQNNNELYIKGVNVQWGTATPGTESFSYYGLNEGSIYIQYFTNNNPTRTWIYVDGSWR